MGYEPEGAEMSVAGLARGRASSTLYLVSCVGQKRASACRARDLYTSEWFKKARAYVEAQGGRWFILSAEYGLLDPNTVIPPYERTLNTMPVEARRDWADRVLRAITPQLTGVERVVILAGERYREFLLERLRAIVPAVEVPMAGLRIGEQLSWLAMRVGGRA